MKGEKIVTMFYSECVINGVLCWRDSPKGEWIQKTPEELTTALIEARNETQSSTERAGLLIPVIAEPPPMKVCSRCFIAYDRNKRSVLDRIYIAYYANGVIL
jgi:hypothetical protein